MQLKIDREFESKIPPLTAEEFRQLEENIVTDGVVINPIITWNGTIVDGHNRLPYSRTASRNQVYHPREAV